MQIWNSRELLLVLGVIVLSLESDFKRLQLIIVLMKQKPAYSPDSKRKEAAESYLQRWRCLLFSVQLVFVYGCAGSLSAVIKVWESHLNSSALSGILLPTPVLMHCCVAMRWLRAMFPFMIYE